MKNLKKAIGFMAVIVFTLAISACTSSKSFTFNVETGDMVKIALDTSDGYTLTQEDGSFNVKKDEEDILHGMFMVEDTYKQYQEIKDLPEVKVLADEEKDGNSYFFYQYEGEAGTETNFILWVKGSSTGVAIASLAGEEEAKAAFDRLSITLVK